MTSQGSYARCFDIEGCDPDGALPEHLAVISSRITDLLRGMTPDMTLYQYFLSVEGFPLPSGSDRSAARRRMTFLKETAGFQSMLIVWCITAAFAKTPARTIASLRVASAAIGNAIPARPMDEHETGAFFSYLMTLDPELITRRLLSRQRVAQQIATQSIQWTSDGLRVGQQHVRQFCLSRRPLGTRADLFARLRRLSGNIILCSEYRRATPEQVRKRVNQLESFTGVFKRKFANLAVHATTKKELEATAGTKAADKSTDDLGKLLIELGDGTTYGQYSLIGLVHGRDPKMLEALLPQIQQVFSDPAQAGMLVEDPIGQHSAYQALLLQPVQNVRRRWWRDTHVANLAFAFLPSRGHLRSEALDSEYLVCYETTERQPWFYDPYTNGLRGLLIIGSPRQGKSVNGNLLIDHEQKYGGFTTVYDVGGAYASTVLAHGGIVTRIGLDGPRFAPFALEPTRENLQAIWLLVRTLLRKGGCILEPRQEESLRGHIRAVYSLPKDVRTLRYLMLPPEQQQYLAKWIGDGIYAHVFDNVNDELELARLQVFDFEGVGDHEELMEPLLMWLTSRKEVQRSDIKYLHLPKHDLFDELWKQIKDPQLWAFLLGDLKTGGKRLGGVTMLTHHVADLGEHAALVKNACPHVMFLPTHHFDRDLYRQFFDLNETQLDEIATQPPRHLCIKTPESWKHLVLNLDGMSLAMYSTSPRDIQRRQILTEQYGQEEALARMAAGA